MTKAERAIANATAVTTALIATARECIAAKNYAGAVHMLDQAISEANAARLFTVADELFNMYVETKVLAFG